MTSPNTPARPTFSRRALVLSLLLFLAVYVLFSVAATLARQRGFLPRDTLAGALVAYAANLALFGGSAYLLAIRPRRITWADLGIAPPRWRWMWLLVAVAVVIVLFPVRIAVGGIVQWVFGGFEALQARQQLLGGELSWTRFLVTLAGAGLLAPIAEELFFRGFLYTALRQHLSLWPAVLLSSAIFGLGHYDAAGVVAAAFIMGIALALVYEYTHSLWVSIAVHAFNNSAAAVLTYALMLLLEWLKHAPRP